MASSGEDFMERRFQEIKQKFAQSLSEKLEGLSQGATQVLGDDAQSATAVHQMYAELHAFCGKAGLVGYEELGACARIVLNTLAPAKKGGRGLCEDERHSFTASLDRFRHDLRTAITSVPTGQI